MKKIIFIFLVLFMFNIRANALNEIDLNTRVYLKDKVTNMIIESINGDKSHSGIPFLLAREDDQNLYCLDPFKKLNTEVIHQGHSYNDKIFNLSDEQLNRINLIAHFGYNYGNHTDINWYGITQLLIWRELDIEDVHFSDISTGDRIDIFKDEMNEIQKLVDDYYKLPSFANQTFKIPMFQDYMLKDENGVLKDFEILESDIEIYKEDNHLLIPHSDDGIYHFKFVKHSPVQNDYILYSHEESQPLLYPGKVDDVTFDLTIEIVGGIIHINKLDSENKSRLEATLEGAEYGLYNDQDKLLTIITTNQYGAGKEENLSIGNYYIKELKASKGYELDRNIYYFEITEEINEITILSRENVIKGNLIINKYFGDENEYNKESSAEFEIYDANYDLIGTYETKDGVLNKTLEYGTYTIKQVGGMGGYSYVDDFSVNIEENKDYVYNLYDKKESVTSPIYSEGSTNQILEVEVPNTFKIDYYRFIPIIFILIGASLIFISKTRKFDI